MISETVGVGTRWTPRVHGRRQGCSAGLLTDATGEGCTCPADYKLLTDLALTGQPLDSRDRDRIKDAIQWARAEVVE